MENRVHLLCFVDDWRRNVDPHPYPNTLSVGSSSPRRVEGEDEKVIPGGLGIKFVSTTISV